MAKREKKTVRKGLNRPAKGKPIAGKRARLVTPGLRDRPNYQAPTTATSKQDLVLMMLNTQEGATISAIIEATGWQAHSIRAFFAKVVRRTLQLKLVSQKIGGERVYWIANASEAINAE